MDNLDKVIDGLECCQYDSKSHCDGCPYNNEGWIGHCTASLSADALDYFNEQDEKLKEQQEERKRMLSWLSKFCRHIDNGDKWLTDEENLEFFREKMKQQFGWFAD